MNESHGDTEGGLHQPLEAGDLLELSQRLLNAGLWEWNIQNNRLFWTSDTYRLFGVDPESFRPTVASFQAMLHPTDRFEIEPLIASLTETKEATLQYRVVRANGEMIRVRDHIAAIFDEDGNLERVAGVIQDITEQWRVDEAFRLVAAGFDGTSENDYFAALTHALTELLGMDVAFIAEWDEPSSTLSAVATSLAGAAVPPRSNQVRPEGECRRVLAGKETVAIDNDVSHRFPDLPIPEGIRLRSMVASPLLSRTGVPIGMTAVMDCSPLKNREGIVQLLKIFSQRTSVELERLQNVRALRQSEARFQSVIQTTLQGFWLIDSHGITIEANTRMSSILGYPEGFLTGRSIYEFVDDENRAIFESQLQQRRDGRHSVYEITLTRKEGTPVDCLFSASPFVENRGEKKGSFALVSDISERKEMEEDLRRSEANMRRAQRIARIGSWTWRIDTDQMTVSEQGRSILNRSVVEAEALTMNRFIEGMPESERQRFLDAVEEALQGDGSIYTETEYDTRQETSSIVIVEGESERNTKGEVIGLTGIIQDVTRQRRLEKERTTLEIRYREAQKLESLGLVAGGINHDFNNILQQLLGLVDLLASSSWGPTEKEYLDMMRAAIDHGGERLRRLLAFSRQSLELSVQVDPCELVSTLVEEMNDATPDAITFAVGCDPAHNISLLGDYGQLRHAIGNLIQNSIDAMKGHGVITVTVTPSPPPTADRHEETWVRIDVDDVGPGVPATWRDKIFDPFFTTRQGGEGLGLSVAHGIVKAHRGEIYFENLPHGGARFSVYLPTSSQPVTPPPPQPENDGRQPLRIYFIDDEELIVTTMVIMLKRFDVEAVGFTDPQELLDRFEADDKPIDGIATDLSMSELSGIDLARKIKRMRPDMPVILCTGFSPDKDWSNEEREAVDAILYKPVEAEGLVNILTALRRGA